MPEHLNSQEIKSSIFVSELINEFSDSLDASEKETLPKIQELLIKFYLELGVKDQYMDRDNPEAITRGTVALALAYEWIKNKSSFANLEVLSEQMLLLFPKKDTTYIEEGLLPSNASVHDETIRAILRAAFEKTQPTIDWDTMPVQDIMSQLASEEESGKIIRMPYKITSPTDKISDAEAFKFLSKVYKDTTSIPPTQHHFFYGLFDHKSGVVLLWIDSDKQTELHEQNHAKYKGLRAGGLGNILDEGMTEELTYRELRLNGITEKEIELLKSKSGYLYTTKIVEELIKSGFEFSESLVRLYTAPEVSDSKVVSKHLIKLLGLSGYAQLYTTLPAKKEEIALLIKLKNSNKKKELSAPFQNEEFVF